MIRVLLILFPLFLFSSPVLAQLSPQQQVQQMVDAVLEVLNDSSDLESKKLQVSGMVQGYLGIRSLSQRTLGKYWKQASEQERARFESLYVQILEKTYLNRLGDYSGGQVDYLQERVKGEKAILDTRFVTETLEIPVQYKLILKEESWRIYDVSIEGVSLVRSYRSSYNEIIRKEGFDGLFGRMEKKLAASDGSGEG